MFVDNYSLKVSLFSVFAARKTGEKILLYTDFYIFVGATKKIRELFVVDCINLKFGGKYSISSNAYLLQCNSNQTLSCHICSSILNNSNLVFSLYLILNTWETKFSLWFYIKPYIFSALSLCIFWLCNHNFYKLISFLHYYEGLEINLLDLSIRVVLFISTISTRIIVFKKIYIPLASDCILYRK